MSSAQIRTFAWISLFLTSLGFAGCVPGPGGGDEEKHPYFLKGKNLAGNMDYEGAVQAYEKALQANPKSAAAHFELGILFKERLKDYPAAIYHFEKHLQFRPDSPLADIIRQHVMACKVELAKTVSFSLINEQVQREMDRLATENRALTEQVQQLNASLQQKQAEFAEAVRGPLEAVIEGGVQGARERVMSSLETVSVPRVTESVAAASPSRTYTVRKDDTFFSISRRYGLKTADLERANPGVDPRRLKVGQVLRLPSGN